MDQRNLFDLPAGRARRDDAVTQVRAHAPVGWMDAMLRCLATLAREREEFTAADVWLRAEKDGIAMPREPRAMGPVMSDAQRRGWIRNTHRTNPSPLPRQNARPIAVWGSRLYKIL